MILTMSVQRRSKLIYQIHHEGCFYFVAKLNTITATMRQLKEKFGIRSILYAVCIHLHSDIQLINRSLLWVGIVISQRL